ncbi:MAG: nitronate monooxygenase, partial [Gammaproteobacteria bacterium]|nr:nitronate monooxygenase [Gammaproteobacteria bacterium]
ATRFVATHECDAAIEFKQLYVDCKKEDIHIIKSPVGLPGRVIKNNFIEEIKTGVKKPFKCAWKCLKSCDLKHAPYCIAQALFHAQSGELNNGFAFAGANAYRTEKIVSVKELIEELKLEYSNYAAEQLNS